MPDGREPAAGGWSRFQVQVDDLQARVEQLQEEGVTFRNDIVEGQGGKQILLEDPAGNPIELFEPQKQSVEPVPEGYHTITPFLLSDDAGALIEFLKAAFDGEVTYMMQSDDGVVRHSTVRIGDSLVMVSRGTDRYESKSSMLHLYVEDVDAVYQQAISAGGTSLREPHDEFYGDRTAAVQDDWDNQWWIATHIEEVSEDEMERREREFREQSSGSP
jgi:uncharacterized glyoxalase superfamily protein PhnB